MPTLDDFAGRWTLSRRIEDDRAGTTWTFRGRALFRRVGEGLVCDEAGALASAGGPTLRAERRYLWRAAGPLIEVRFADGRRFHCFDPRGEAAEAEHLCGPDLYRVRYDFVGWPCWRATWRVNGSRKDLRIVSGFTPACAASEGGAEPGRVSAE